MNVWLLVSGDGGLSEWSTGLFILRDYPLVNPQIVLAHAARTEALLKDRTALHTVDGREAVNGLYRFLYALHNKPGHTVFDNLGHRSAAKSDDRSAAGHGFN